MRPTLHTSARAVVLAALLGGSALAVPAAVRAQSVTPERALVNTLEQSHRGTVTDLAQARVAHVPSDRGLVDGERALLNRSGTRPYQDEQPEGSHAVVPEGPSSQGVRALLNRSGS